MMPDSLSQTPLIWRKFRTWLNSAMYIRLVLFMNVDALIFTHSHRIPSERLIINFTRRYCQCEDAHRHAFEHGIAPKLLSVQSFHGWYFIVMENVSNACLSIKSISLEKKSYKLALRRQSSSYMVLFSCIGRPQRSHPERIYI
ncbi:hypothetical protein BT96DRAFT_378810 [Gymnopus androsaceus JB14]|uniref:Uncharacterized protein n=1 Tax=Gymnopus androsaceus JB14 TaxID=1447944 RepID=A0A6A4IIY3_9AGAR|nr:hypothetical protein BT96DRAFT_378810 [Gymnopus androsaceus JB14]